jgi:nitrate reductase NapE component
VGMVGSSGKLLWMWQWTFGFHERSAVSWPS